MEHKGTSIDLGFRRLYLQREDAEESFSRRQGGPSPWTSCQKRSSLQRRCRQARVGQPMTKKGGTYQATSYLSARAAIQRKVTAANRPFNLRVDSEFRESNIVLDAVLKHNKMSGQAKQRTHKDVITDLDKDRLAKYFEGVLESQDTPLNSNSFRCFAGTTWHDTWVFPGRRCS